MWGRTQNGCGLALTALLSLFLVVCVIGLALHVHANTSASNDVHCAACATLHSVAPGVTAGFVVQLTNAPLAPRQVVVAYTSHQPSSNLLVRPPPSA